MIRVKFDEKNKVWRSCGTPPIFNSNVSIGHTLLKLMKVNGPKIAQISDDYCDRMTFEELRTKTIRFAQNLQARGYNQKQIIGIVADNVPNLAPVVIASICLGCPINPIHTLTTKTDFLHMLQLTEPGLIFCEVKVYDIIIECLHELGKQTKIFTFNGTSGDSESIESLFEETGTEDEFIPVEVDGINDIAAIVASSGTTGRFKGICLSHATLLTHIADLEFLNTNDVFLSNSTLNWISGLRVFLMGTIVGATRVITSTPFSPELYLSIIEKHKVTVYTSLAFNLLKMLRCGQMSTTDLSSIKHMIGVGCKIPVCSLMEIKSYLPNGSVHTGYGLSEMAGTVAIDFPGFRGNDTVGRLLNSYTAKVINDKGNRCGINVNGEICLKGRFKFMGYYKNKQLTEEHVDSEGFFMTGDIGHFDENGYLYIVDRKKSGILNMDWVWPNEIESFLLKSQENSNACVVGVFNGIHDVPGAIVVRANGSKITEQTIYKMVADHFPANHRLDGGIYFVDALPTSITGKTLRNATKELAAKFYETKYENNRSTVRA